VKEAETLAHHVKLDSMLVVSLNTQTSFLMTIFILLMDLDNDIDVQQKRPKMKMTNDDGDT